MKTKTEWEMWAKSFPIRAFAGEKYISPFTVNAQGQTVDVLIYGPIGRDWMSDDGMAAADFAKILGEIPREKKVRLRINSPGGNVWDGFAIYNLAKERGVETRVDGVAASIAAVILCAGKSEAAEASSVMIHKCWGLFIGNTDAIGAFKAQLDKHDEMQASVFGAKTGKTPEEMKKEMSGDRWFTAREAQEFGFVDTLAIAAPTKAASLSAPLQAAGNPQTKNQNHMKTEILALLTEWGVEVKADATDDQLLSLVKAGKPTPTPAPTPSPPATSEARIAALEASLMKDRIERDLDVLVADEKLSTAERSEFLPLCLEAGGEAVLAALKKRPAIYAGIAPLKHIEVGGISVLENFRKLSAGRDRRTFLREHYAGLREQMHRVRGPQAANTVDSALVTAFLADALVVVAQNRLAMVNLFTRDFPSDPIKPLATVQIRKVMSGAASAQDPTNFEAGGDSNLDNIAVTMHQEGHPFHVSNTDMLNGVRLEHLAEINSEAFVNTLSDRITAVMTVANFGTALTIGSAGNFTPDDLSPILAVAKNYRSKNLILDGGHLAYVTPKKTDELDWMNTGAFGFDKIAEQNRWTGAATNAVGFVCGPDAIAIASGVAVELPAAEYEQVTMTALKNGMTVRTTVHFVRGTRNWQVYHDIMLGVAAGDTTQAEVLITS